jgi:transposase-like protein
MYLYRAVDERGRTVESHLSRTRDMAAAKAFFRKALQRHRATSNHHARWLRTQPFRAPPDGHAQRVQLPLGNPVKIRSCQYLNNIVEQDHRGVKFRVQPMLGFKSFYNARRVLIGIELMQKILKGQFRVPAHFGHNFGSIWRNALA